MRADGPIAFVAALREELATVPLAHERTESLPWGIVRRGWLGRTPVVLVAAGIGRDAARRATERICHETPAIVIALGFSGGLAEPLEAGDLVLARSLAFDGEEPVLEPPGLLLNCAQQALGKAGRVSCGPAVTASAVAAGSEDKALLARSGALAVDLESYWIAREATAAGLPWLAIRSVVDRASTHLPRFATEHQGKRARDFVLPALRHALSRPSGVLDLAWLGWAAHLAAKSLGRAAERLPQAFSAAEGT